MGRIKRSYIAKRFQVKTSRLTLNPDVLNKYDDVIDLSIGDTDFTTDGRIIDAAFRDARAGYTHYGDPKGDPELVRTINRVNGSLIYSAPSVSQRAAIAALSMRESIRREYVRRYRDRVFYASDRIEKLPYLELCRPRGTFYLFPGIKKTGLSSARFCEELLEKAHVLVSAGHVFGKI